MLTSVFNVFVHYNVVEGRTYKDTLFFLDRCLIPYYNLYHIKHIEIVGNKMTREILCFGDSNTYGLIPGTKERYKENIRWTGILQQKLKEKDCRIVEEGLCGRTTVFEDELRKNRKGSDLLPVLLESHAHLYLLQDNCEIGIKEKQ